MTCVPDPIFFFSFKDAAPLHLHGSVYTPRPTPSPWDSAKRRHVNCRAALMSLHACVPKNSSGLYLLWKIAHWGNGSQSAYGDRELLPCAAVIIQNILWWCLFIARHPGPTCAQGLSDCPCAASLLNTCKTLRGGTESTQAPKGRLKAAFQPFICGSPVRYFFLFLSWVDNNYSAIEFRIGDLFTRSDSQVAIFASHEIPPCALYGQMKLVFSLPR